MSDTASYPRHLSHLISKSHMMVAFISVNIFKYFRWEIDMLGNVFSVCDSFTPKVFNILRLPFFDSSASSTSSSGKISKYFTCSLIYKANVVCFRMSAFLLFSWHWFLLSRAPVGEVLGFENLVFSIFEFVHALLENSKFKSTVKKALPELIYYIILYMQITEEQVSGARRQASLLHNRHRETNYVKS